MRLVPEDTEGPPRRLAGPLLALGGRPRELLYSAYSSPMSVLCDSVGFNPAVKTYCTAGHHVPLLDGFLPVALPPGLLGAHPHPRPL